MIKEKFGYICPDVAKEFNKYDSQPDKWFKIYDGINSVTKKVISQQLVALGGNKILIE